MRANIVAHVPSEIRMRRGPDKRFEIFYNQSITGLEPKLRFYLPLYLNLIFETCLSRDDGKTIIPHTQVIADLSRDTVRFTREEEQEELRYCRFVKVEILQLLSIEFSLRFITAVIWASKAALLDLGNFPT